MKILEIIKIQNTKKTPLMIEVQVPPKCTPFLVGNPKNDSLLKWTEYKTPKDTIYTWGIKTDLQSIINEMINKVSEKEWDITHPNFKSAQKRMLDLGLDEVHQIGNLVIPTDPSLLGSIIVIGDTYFPIIHNSNRALCVIK